MKTKHSAIENARDQVDAAIKGTGDIVHATVNTTVQASRNLAAAANDMVRGTVKDARHVGSSAKHTARAAANRTLKSAEKASASGNRAIRKAVRKASK